MAKEQKKPDTDVAGVAAAIEKDAGTGAAAKEAEALYTAPEFAQNARKLFGEKANADIVVAAFRTEGKERATLSEAKDIVEKFMSKEVK